MYISVFMCAYTHIYIYIYCSTRRSSSCSSSELAALAVSHHKSNIWVDAFSFPSMVAASSVFQLSTEINPTSISLAGSNAPRVVPFSDVTWTWEKKRWTKHVFLILFLLSNTEINQMRHQIPKYQIIFF